MQVISVRGLEEYLHVLTTRMMQSDPCSPLEYSTKFHHPKSLDCSVPLEPGHTLPCHSRVILPAHALYSQRKDIKREL